MQCFNCLALDQLHNREHVLGAALGGGLKTNAFCKACNELFGKEIDAPVARAHWIHELRHRYAIKDRYGKVPPPPRLAVTVDGDPAVLTVRPEGCDLEIFPKAEIDRDEFHLRVSSEREEEVLAKKLERLRKKYGKAEIVARRVERSQPTAQLTELVSLSLWARLTAKIMLGIASTLAA